MSHPVEAEKFTNDVERTTWHDETLWFVRQKRDRAVYAIPEFQQLRELASQIKDHTLSNLDEYLVQFEQQALQHGVHVHWASNALEHNQIIADIIKKKNAKHIVKSKSMLTEECGLNIFLQQQNIEVVDTDLGERIIQLRDEHPSHIVLPAIHLKKEDVGKTFHQNFGTPENETDPQRLTEAARIHLREKFLSAEVALSGVNFAIAETGSIVICTNEGNADLGVNIARTHIASMGIEKIIPKWEHLGVFTRLLARSATGQPVTTYTSHFTKPREGSEMHVVIVDNGRTEQLNRPDFRSSLKCIRCGACINTCPVYRRSGGHSYNFTVPGPIGAILSPNIDLKKHGSLSFASTLCGSCSDVCPVKIDIHTQLYKWRQIIAENDALPKSKKWSMIALTNILKNSFSYQFAGKTVRFLLKIVPRKLIYINALNPWGKKREVPSVPKESFKEWYEKNHTT